MIQFTNLQQYLILNRRNISLMFKYNPEKAQNSTPYDLDTAMVQDMGQNKVCHEPSITSVGIDMIAQFWAATTTEL